MKLMKKVWALALSLIMVLAMGVTVFADVDTYSITVNNETEGYEYTAYQVFTGTLNTIDGKDTLGNIKWSDEVDGDAILTAIKASTAFGEGDANIFKDCTDAAAVAAVLQGITDDSAQAIAFADIVGRNVVGDGHALTYNATDKNYSVSGLTSGYYIVSNTKAPTGETTSRYILEVVKNVQVNTKVADKPDIDKKITNTGATEAKDDSKKTNTAAIGDVINFEITGSVPNYTGYTYYYYVVNDTLSEGLTLNDADNAGFTVTVGGTPLTRGTDYFVYKDGQSFKVAFNNIMGYTISDAIVITYSATINEKAAIGTEANKNTANLTYSNNPNTSDKHDKTGEPGVPDGSDKTPTGKTTDKVTKTYVTELQLTKVDQDGNKLEGAEFTLFGDNLKQVKFTTGTAYEEDANGNYWKLKDGTYTTDDPATEGMDQSKYASTTTKYTTKTVVTSTDSGEANVGKYKVTAYVDNNGYIKFTGLNAGTYTLRETRTPDGYNTVADKTIVISAAVSGSTNNEGGDVTWSTTTDGVTATDAGVFTITVQNNKGSSLPSTGGMGTTIFYVIGTILVLGAAVVLITRRRMSK